MKVARTANEASASYSGGLVDGVERGGDLRLSILSQLRRALVGGIGRLLFMSFALNALGRILLEFSLSCKGEVRAECALLDPHVVVRKGFIDGGATGTMGEKFVNVLAGS